MDWRGRLLNISLAGGSVLMGCGGQTAASADAGHLGDSTGVDATHVGDSGSVDATHVGDSGDVDATDIVDSSNVPGFDSAFPQCNANPDPCCIVNGAPQNPTACANCHTEFVGQDGGYDPCCLINGLPQGGFCCDPFSPQGPGPAHCCLATLQGSQCVDDAGSDAGVTPDAPTDSALADGTSGDSALGDGASGDGPFGDGALD